MFFQTLRLHNSKFKCFHEQDSHYCLLSLADGEQQNGYLGFFENVTDQYFNIQLEWCLSLAAVAVILSAASV